MSRHVSKSEYSGATLVVSLVIYSGVGQMHDTEKPQLSAETPVDHWFALCSQGYLATSSKILRDVDSKAFAGTSYQTVGVPQTRA